MCSEIVYLGLDISKQNFDAALLDPTSPSTKPRHKAFPNTEAGFERLIAWLGQRKVHACLEATNTYGEALARFLHAQGHTVSIVNPARIKAFATTQLSRAKTDKADALLIAQFCRMHQPEAWTPPSPEIATLQALVRRLESLQQMRQMEQNRLNTAPPAVQASLSKHIVFLDRQIEQTQKAIADHVDSDPGLKQQSDLLDSIPGIGRVTAAVVLAELGDVSEFTSAKQVAAFAGLDPRIRQSGSSVQGRASLSKSGSPRLRKGLYFPALAALRFNPAIRELRERLLLAGKNKKLIVGAAMRKLLQIAFGVLKSGLPFDACICTAVFPVTNAPVTNAQAKIAQKTELKLALAA